MVINRVLDSIFNSWANPAVLRSLLDSTTGFTGREVARLSGIHPQTAFKTLSNLEELNIVKRQRGGRDHIFTLNRDHYLVQEIILKAFQTETKFFEKIIKELELILKKRVYSAVIFGSTARSEDTPLSDLDICCIVNSQIDYIFVRDSLSKKSQLLYQKYGIKLAPIFFLKDQFMRKRKSKLIKSIAEEGILITGKSPKGLLNG